jgi:hypothetical protein
MEASGGEISSFGKLSILRFEVFLEEKKKKVAEGYALVELSISLFLLINKL